MEPARKRQVLDESGAARGLVRQIPSYRRLADNPVFAWRSGRSRFVDFTLKERLVRAFPERRASPRSADRAVIHPQFAGWSAKALGGALEQQGSRMRACAPQG